MSYQRQQKNIDVLVCESGLLVKISDIKRISVKPFAEDDRIVDKLRNVEERAVYIETRNDGIQKVDLEDKFNTEYNLGTSSTYDKGEGMFRSIVESWYKLNSERD